ncbi:hypothetical protein IGI53_003145 [Enterococcus sp. DIV0788_1]
MARVGRMQTKTRGARTTGPAKRKGNRGSSGGKGG